MSLSLLEFLGIGELLAFFVADVIYARFLSAHKADHPELEACAPDESPDLDTAAVLDSLAATAVHVYQHEFGHLSRTNAAANGYTAVAEASMEPVAAETSVAAPRNPLHMVVVISGAAAPLLTGLTLLAPGLTRWYRVMPPAWLSLPSLAMGLAATVLYVLRTYALSGMAVLTRSQWISLMWFRLDFLFLLSIVALTGVGLWLVAGCMIAVAAYLAHRVMRMERQWGRLQRDTQLVQREVDVQRVLPPGTAEARKALGHEEGYSAMA